MKLIFTSKKQALSSYRYLTASLPKAFFTLEPEDNYSGEEMRVQPGSL